MCFERGEQQPTGQTNICTCVEVDFIASDEICKKTDIPTVSPSLSPTRSPTVCKGPPPDNKQDDCSSAVCQDNLATVVVNRNPQVTTNIGAGTTTLCYSYTINGGSGLCDIGVRPVVGVAFSMDECCDDGIMDFMTRVAIGNEMFTRAQCPNIGSNNVAGANAPGCNRAVRDCVAAKSLGQQCSVINLNDVNVGGNNEYCITVVGTTFEGPNNQLTGPSDIAKMCFERGEQQPSGQTNICTCVEVDFIASDEICKKTDIPTISPSLSPTRSPTVCKGPPPDNKQDDCSSAVCQDNLATVVVNRNPQVTTDFGAGTTTLCYSYTINGGSGICGIGVRPVVGVAFSMDECCDDGIMDFMTQIMIGNEMFTRAQCPNVGSNNAAGANAPGCNRAVRDCAAAKSVGQQCSVINLNDVNVGGNNEYCITVVGTAFEGPNNQLNGPKDVAKMCFERGEQQPSGQTNICTCVEVDFIASDEICKKTDVPTVSPSLSPTRSPTVCKGPPPDNKQDDCSSAICQENLATVVVNEFPRVTTDLGAGTSTLCYSYTINGGSGLCDIGVRPVVGVAFSMDECCDDGIMDFMTQVAIGNEVFTRAECPNVGSNNAVIANQPGCNRAVRDCAAAKSVGQLCSVINLNDVNVVGNNEYCITVVGTTFEGTDNDLVGPTDRAKMCFERGDQEPSGQTNICTCVEVEFIGSDEICKKTDIPTVSPSLSPTRSPTVCKGPPPDNKQDDCSSASCDAAVSVDATPRITVDIAAGTTTLCYAYQVSNPGGSCDIGVEPVVGVAFSMDECCDDGIMDFMEEVSIGNEVFNRDDCPNVGSNDAVIADLPGCNRAVRDCVAAKSVGQQCSVINLNDVNVLGNSEYCITVVGTDYDANGQIAQPPEKAKICFERGEMTPEGSTNICSCAEIDFVPSDRICKRTDIPTRFPSLSPTKSPTVCEGPPPDNKQDDCSSAICQDNLATVVVNPSPRVTTDFDVGTTTLCYSYTINGGSGLCDIGVRPVVGVAFSMDECCDDGLMDFMTQVMIGNEMFTRAECPNVGSNDGAVSNQPGCNRAVRDCAVAKNLGQKCSVINLNDVNVTGNNEYCITVIGTTFEGPNNELDGPKDIAKMCFERGDPQPSGQTNICTCAEVEFIASDEICEKTDSPTKSPTMSPTVCIGPPPDNKQDDCSEEDCRAAIDIDSMPDVTTNEDDGTTTLCYKYSVSNPGGACEIGDSPVVGVAFSMDECCPDGEMEFMSQVSIGSKSFSRADCPKVGSNDKRRANRKGCNRATRDCTPEERRDEKCSVLNLNDVDVDGDGEYCITVVGTGFERNGRLIGEVEKAKMCFERGEKKPEEATNICSCVEVDFIPSREICNTTPSPSPSPTAAPTLSPTRCIKPPPNAPPVQGCQKRCGDIYNTEWTAELKTHQYYIDEYENKYTLFEYCVHMSKTGDQRCKPDAPHEDVCPSGGDGSGGRSPRGGGSWDGGRRLMSSWAGEGEEEGEGEGDSATDLKYFSPGTLTLRLDECCPLCLQNRHFGPLGSEYESLDLTNPTDEDDSAWMSLVFKEKKINRKKRIDRKKKRGNGVRPNKPQTSRCFDFKMHGVIDVQPGKYCVKGGPNCGPRCGCGDIDVPFTCDIKKYSDPSCQLSGSDESNNGGDNGGNGGGNGGDNGGNTSGDNGGNYGGKSGGGDGPRKKRGGKN